MHLFTTAPSNRRSLGVHIMLGTGSEVHLGFVQAVAHKHLLSGNMDWDLTGRKVLRFLFTSAEVQL